MSLADAADFAVAAWPLTEASGTRNDQVGSNHLTDNNTVGQGIGKVNANCADFERDNSEYLSIDDNAAISMGDIDFCVRCWVKLESKGADRSILAKFSGFDSTNDYRLQYIQTSDRFRFEVFSPSLSSAAATANNLGSPSTGVWYLIHAWHDSTNNLVGISVNAGAANTTPYSDGVADRATPLHVGNGGFFTTSYWDGLIDDVVILKNRILTADERTEDYNGGAGIAFANWAGSGELCVPSSLGLGVRLGL